MAGAGRALSVPADRFPNLVVTEVGLGLGTHVLDLDGGTSDILFLRKRNNLDTDSEVYPCGDPSGSLAHHIPNNVLFHKTGVE